MSKKEWGNCIWITFHTLAEKLKIENQNETSNILKHIIAITTILPCPYCREHSKKKLYNLNTKNIKNKHDLKLFLFQFHNMVNEDTKKEKFNIDILDTYSKYNFNKVLKYFFDIMNKKYRTHSSMSISINKKKILKDFNLYLINNYHKFDY